LVQYLFSREHDETLVLVLSASVPHLPGPAHLGHPGVDPESLSVVRLLKHLLEPVQVVVRGGEGDDAAVTKTRVRGAMEVAVMGVLQA
jgi:hypothetical protein